MLAVAVALTLGGCGSNAKKPKKDPSSTSTADGIPHPTPTLPPYLPVPSGIRLTPPGKGLSVGLAANVAWVPRQDEIGVVRVRVQQIEVSTMKRSFSDFELTPKQESSTPYFVHYTVFNIGERSLAARKLPLYLATTSGSLVEASDVDRRFKACPRGVLPDEFAEGAHAKLCAVFLLPKGLDPMSVSFVPAAEVDAIFWQGQVDTYRVHPKKGHKKKGRGRHAAG